MQLLRWIIGTITVCLGGSYFILLVMGNAFRRSFGASENGIVLSIVPFVAATAILLSVLFPFQKWMLHAAAGLVFPLMLVSLLGLTKAPGLSTVGILYFGCWIVFYFLALGLKPTT